MAVLVTGGCGYIGSDTVELLHDAGREVVVIVNLSRGHRGAMPTEVPFYRGDVGDRTVIERLSRRARTGGVCPLRRADLCGRVGTGAGAVLPEQRRPEHRLVRGTGRGGCAPPGVLVDVCHLRRARAYTS